MTYPDPDLSQCHFYHTMDLPEGTIHGDWDLRPVIQSYLGNVDVRGKRVLDIGTATGFLSFHCERSGAKEVVSFDAIGGGVTQDGLPDQFKMVKNSYWYCYKRLGSNCNVVYGDVYNLEVDGLFDIAILGSILLHLENPYGAIRNAARVAKTIIVTDGHWPHHTTEHLIFRPSFPVIDDWWHLPHQTVSKMLKCVGFIPGEPIFLRATGTKEYKHVDLYSIVAHKI